MKYFDLNEMDKAEVRHEFRKMYKDIGFTGSLRCLYELLISSEILMEVISEERKKEMEQQGL